jgi:hypothetical protein
MLKAKFLKRATHKEMKLYLSKDLRFCRSNVFLNDYLGILMSKTWRSIKKRDMISV